MEENNIQTEVATTDEQVVETVDNATEQTGENPAPRKKGIKGLIEYIKAHEDLRQMVLFLLFSVCCGITQFVTQFILKYVIGAFNKSEFSWFIFVYNQEKGLAEFIGFICGAVIGQVMTFVLNRKKTFKATNNVAIAGTMYAIVAVGIIILQTYLGGVVTTACKNTALANGTSIEGVYGFLFTLTGMVVGSIAALILSFLGNKFLIMRDWSKKKKPETETEE